MKRKYSGLMSPDGRLLYVNDAALGLIDANLNDIIGVPIWKSPWYDKSPRAAKIVQELVEQTVKTEQRMETEITLHLKNGPVELDYSLRPLRCADGEIVALMPEADEFADTKITEREKEVLRWIAAGKTALETGIILDLSQRTVEWYLKEVRRKLGAVTTPQAVGHAIRASVIGLGLGAYIAMKWLAEVVNEWSPRVGDPGGLI